MLSRFSRMNQTVLFVALVTFMLLVSCESVPTGQGNGNGQDVPVTAEDIVEVLKSDPDFIAMVKGEMGFQGESGPQGESGVVGQAGPRGLAGLSCWDLDADGVKDSIEDVNADGVVDAQDCRGDAIACNDCADLFVGVDESDSITSTMLQEESVSLEKLDDSGAQDGQAILFDGMNIVWGNVGDGAPSGPAGGDLSGSYPNPSIKSAAVTLAKISAVGASTGDVVTYNGSNIVWDAPQAASKPLIEFEEPDDHSQVLTTSWQTVIQVTINAPSVGRIHVIGTATLNIGADAGNPALVGISTSSNNAPTNVPSRADHADADAGASVPVTTQFVANIGVGAHTYYLVAERLSNTSPGNISISRPQLSATFIPN